MAANPGLVRLPGGDLVPAPFAHEMIVLQRPGVSFEIDEVHTSSSKWAADGVLYLTNYRLVFVAAKPDPSGLAAFDIPLAYVHGDKLNQPIFGCNHLSGKVWPAVVGGGPAGTLPPHAFKVYFTQGGIGTFFPLYALMSEAAKAAATAAAGAAAAAARGESAAAAQEAVGRAFIDPADPSTVFITQPVDDRHRAATQPVYAENYGEDEVYEPMEPTAPAAPR